MLEAQSKERPRYSISLDRLWRALNQVERLGYNNLVTYAITIIDSKDGLEPSSNNEAMECKVSIHWMELMDEEVRSLYNNNT